MLILSIETSSKFASAALLRDGVIVGSATADKNLKHAETVLPMIAELLKHHDIPISDIDLYAVDVGPGSFTGIRIGLSVVDALSYVNRKKIVPVASLDVLYSSVSEGNKKNICSIIDARNNNVYVKIFKNGKTVLEEGAYTIDELRKYTIENLLFVGDISLDGSLNEEDKKYPDAVYVAKWAYEHSEHAVDTVKALYLRLSQAERINSKG